MKRTSSLQLALILLATLAVASLSVQGQNPPKTRYSFTNPVLVSETKVNSGGNEANTSPSITPLSQGRFIIAWHDGGPTSGWGRVYLSGGVPAGAQFALDPHASSGWKYGHVVAALPNDGIVSFWGYASGSVQGQQFDSQFMPVGGDFFNFGANDWPAVASSNGNPVLNIDYPNSGGSSVLIVPFDSSLNQYPTITANQFPPGVGLSPAVAAAPNGNFTVVWWNAAGNIILRTFDANRNPLTDEVVVNSSSGGSRNNPALAYSGNNELWIAWAGNQSSDYDIYLRHFAADGTPKGGEFKVNQNTSGDQTVPQLAVASTGEVAVSWTGSDTSGLGVFGRIFGPSGKPFTDEFQINQYTSGDQYTGWFGGRRGNFISEESNYLVFTWRGTGAQGGGVYMTIFKLTPPGPLVTAN